MSWIRTIRNANYFCWSNWEPSICSLGRVQIHPIMQCLREITIWKVNWPRNYMMKMYGIRIFQNQVYFRSLCTSQAFLIFILVKFYCFTSSFVPNIEAKSVVLELTTRDSEYCCWFLLAWGNMKIYLHFLIFLDIEMVFVFEILPCGKVNLGPVYPQGCF